jgi:hypothetical protein
MSAEEMSPLTHPSDPKSALSLVGHDPQRNDAAAELLAELEEYVEAEEHLVRSLTCRDARYTECVSQSQALASAARREIYRLGRRKNAPE